MTALSLFLHPVIHLKFSHLLGNLVGLLVVGTSTRCRLSLYSKFMQADMYEGLMSNMTERLSAHPSPTSQVPGPDV